MSLVVDRLGLTGGGKRHISPRRITAAILTVLAVLVSVWDRLDAKDLSVVAIILGILTGGIVGVQRALNGQVNEHSGQSFATSLLNFITGTTLLFFLFLGGLITHHAHFTSLKVGPWWMYLGGVTRVHVGAYLVTGIVMTYIGVIANSERLGNGRRTG